MILARPIAYEAPSTLEVAFARMGLPTPAREYLLAKLPHLTVLLSGIGPSEGRFLKGLVERADAPGVELYPAYVPGAVQTRPGTALLSGRLDQFHRLREALAGQKELSALLEALAALDRLDAPPAPTQVGRARFSWGERTYLMGVVNITPDSFSDGGSFLDPSAAVEQGLKLVEAGADLLDLGAESTRPGAAPVSAEEELRRLLPVMRALRARTDRPLSVDTSKGEVARAALSEGADFINDISGLSFEPDLAKVVAEKGAALCVMHIRGTPRTMQADPRYDDLMADVLEGLQTAVARAEQAGVAPQKIWVDPGIGFGKTGAHNLFLLRRARELRLLGRPVLVGTSRKAFLGPLSGGKPPRERLVATAASVAALAVQGGADVVRVHDVAEAREAVAVADAIRRAQDGGALSSPQTLAGAARPPYLAGRNP